MSMTPDQTPYQSGWWGADLGKYRACDSTYCLFEYDSLPPLDESVLQGDFRWLTPPTAATEKQMQPHQPRQSAQQVAMLAQLQQLEQALVLPPAFRLFMSRTDWQDAMPSCTANYFLLPDEPVTNPFGGKSHWVNFFNDQQEVLQWYLYLAPTGEHSVMVTAFDLARDQELLRYDPARYRAQVWFCAPSFEAFLYRYWLENTIWFGLDEGSTLSAAQQSYLAHYAGQ
jgi:hypothetical protein